MDVQPIDADDVGGQIGQIDGPDFAGRRDGHIEDGEGINTREPGRKTKSNIMEQTTHDCDPSRSWCDCTSHHPDRETNIAMQKDNDNNRDRDGEQSG